MAMDTLKITLVQLDIIWENAQSNINHITLLIKDIVNTDIIVLPEMFATGLV
jgi:predicted amidohydrolase